MKACCYCVYGQSDDQGTWCSVDWDSLEYAPQWKQDKVNAECARAQDERDALTKEVEL